MEKRGQIFLLVGVILNSIYLILARIIPYKAGLLDFVYGVLLGLSLTFLVAGLIYTFKAKRKEK